MKPRDLLNRRKRLYLTIVGTSFAAMAVLGFTEKSLPPSLFRAAAAASVAAFALGVLLVYFGITCPKCKAILGLSFVFGEETLRKCRRCGIDFDEDRLPGS